MAGVMGFATPPAALQQAPEEGSYLEKLQKILMGGGNPGGMLDANAEKAARNQAMMAMAAQLMQAGGYSDRPVSFGQALGSGMQAGMQAQQGAQQQALQSLLIQSQIQKAKQKHRGKLVPIIGQDGKPTLAYEADAEGKAPYNKPLANSTPAGIQEYEYFNKLTPEEQKRFLSLQRSPVVPQVVTVNGVPTLVDRTTGETNPLSSLGTETNAAQQLKEAESRGSAFGKAGGEMAAGILKKGSDAKAVQGLLEGADALIDVATGSAAGAVRDKAAAVVGYSPKSAQATAELQILQANLMLQQPRMEGPQGVLDVQLYEKMAGQIGDPTVPADQKKAALRTIRRLQEKYVERADALGPATPGAQPTASPKRIRVDAEGNVIQ